ncbi:MAG: NAD(+) synthase [Planctomycetes bacterium]|nr:NAD(+) synthase [Planctomycetota bacterium]
MQHGFVRVAAAVPQLRVGDCRANLRHMSDVLAEAHHQNAAVAVFPELGLTGYTCGDLFHQTALQRGALHAVDTLLQQSERTFRGLTAVGLPLLVDDQLYNCAAVLQRGRLLGVIPKSYLPNYKEFYDARWFAPGFRCRNQNLNLLGQSVPFGVDLLFDAGATMPGLVVGVEICEDLWTPLPPSSFQALAGATVLLNLSASNEVIGKAAYRRQLVIGQSGRCVAGYVYVSAGVHESTTDLVFGGHALIAENGTLLAETPRFDRADVLLAQDLDIDRLVNDRIKTNSFGDVQPMVAQRTWRRISFQVERPAATKLMRDVDAHPFVPRGKEQLRERCEEIFHTQVAGLAKRIEHIGAGPLTLGVSGGLDSTLALLVACKTLDLLKSPRTRLEAITMPGFGTSQRTLKNAQALMKHLGVSGREIDIRQICLDEMLALGHKPFGVDLKGLTLEELTRNLQKLPAESSQDLVFENVQARMRTSLLMNKAFVIGTADVSELALGWCTYNGDHMSMYNPNISIPKTLVKFLVRWAAENEFEGAARRTLLDIVATQISPELLPASDNGQMPQPTEGVIGPYEVLDFFLFHFLRYGAPPEKVLFLAEHTEFDRSYTAAELRQWLAQFLRRFFANQFKRSCLPDGPKVGTISLSPRGDWRMPSDAAARVWLEWAEEKPIKKQQRTVKK